MVDGEGSPLTLDDLRRKRLRSMASLKNRRGGIRLDEGRICGAPLWQADREGPRRVALADYIKKHLRHAYDLLVLYEVHEFKARSGLSHTIPFCTPW